MNARVLKTVACTAVASLGLLLLPILGAPVARVAQAAETAAAVAGQAALGTVGCMSVDRSYLLLGQLGSCPLDVIGPVLSAGSLLPTVLVGTDEIATASAPVGDVAAEQVHSQRPRVVPESLHPAPAGSDAEGLTWPGDLTVEQVHSQEAAGRAR